MAEPRLFFAALDAAARACPLRELATPVLVRVQLDGNSWRVHLSPSEPGSAEREDPPMAAQPADFTVRFPARGGTARLPTHWRCAAQLTSSTAVLLDLAHGRRKPVTAFMKGLVSTQGDRSILRPFSALLKAAAEEMKRRASEEPAAAELRVVVRGASVVADSRETFAVYLLEVREGEAGWTTARRWSEVRALDRRVGRVRPARRGLPRLSRALDFAGSLEPSFLSRRARIIEAYLEEVVRAVGPISFTHPTDQSRALVDFLSPSDFSAVGSPLACTPPRGHESPHAHTQLAYHIDARTTVESDTPALISPSCRRSASRGRSPAARGASGLPTPTSSCSLRYSSHFSSATLRAASPGRAIDAAVADHRLGAGEPPPAVRAAGEGMESDEPRSHRIPDWYEPSEGTKRRQSAAQPSVGLLLHRLIAAAGTEMIRAEANSEALRTKRAMLSRLRALEAREAASRRPSRVRAAAASLGAALCCVLTAALVLLAAHHARPIGMLLALSAGAWQLVRLRPSSWLLTLAMLAPLLAAYAHPLPPACDGVCLREPSAPTNGTAGAAGALDARACVASLLGVDVGLETIARGGAMAIQRAGHALLLYPRAAAALLLCEAGVAWLHAAHGRLARVYSIGFFVLFVYWLVGRLCTRVALCRSREDRLYACVHRAVAPLVCRHVMSLRSVYVKFAQYISGRADLVPPEWVASLQLLQDEMPASPPRHVRRAVAAEFGRACIRERFESLDMAPIASASVAQVHVGVLRGEATAAGERLAGGERVVLKLQHEGIEPLMKRDIRACLRLASAMVRLKPDLTPLRTVLEAWQKELAHECDFTHEANNLREVRANLERANLEAVVPRPIDGLVGVRAFVMTFEDGFKVTDRDALAVHAVDCEALMLRIVQIYAQQLLVDGFFNADPHPGNLMVAVRDGRAVPVLLDFGMTVRLSDEQRLGYARLALAAQQMDLCALQQAIRSLGVVTNQSNQQPDRDLEFWRFFLRDTGGREGARHERTEFFALRKSQRASDKRAQRPTRKLAAIPPSLIFFWRVVELLRGLCASLDVKVPYMEILASRAKIALASLVPPPQRALAIAPPPAELAGAGPLHLRLAALLAQLCDEGAVGAGVQVCVMRGGRTLAEASAGFRGVVDPRGMHPLVRMPLVELSALLPVLTLHALVGAGMASYDTPIAPSWPGCARLDGGGGRAHTIGDALAHRVPVDGAFAWKQPPAQLASLAAQFAALAEAPLREPTSASRAVASFSAFASDSGRPPRSSGRPSALSNESTASSDGGRSAPRSSGVAYGTLLAGIIEGLSGKPYTEVLQTLLLEPLGLAGRLYGAHMPEEHGADAASVSAGFAAQIQNLRTTLAGSTPGSADGNADDSADLSAAPSPSPHAATGIGAMADAFAHELPLNVGVVNSPILRAGCAPAIGAFGAARDVCALLAAVARGELSLPLRAIGEPCGVEESLLFGDRVWGRGLQRYECRGGPESHVLGLHSFGGSFAFFGPRSLLSVAILLNDCQLDYSVTRRILDLLAAELTFGTPEFLGRGLF
ncbi:hypothetical protein AB1Y20_004578 [Prymnesium parvum]|uniref:PX domain-containing protein n=1 Tax=Prymnesium parvum TaxID=97485 RepID=A0AB34IWV6_PRYPA